MKIKNILIILLSTFLVSCEIVASNSNDSSNQEPISSESKGETPKIKGNRDFNFAVEKDGFIAVNKTNFLGNTTATDAEDGDITANIQITVTNYYTGEEVKVIQKSGDGKYKLVYTITDSDGNTDSELNYIIVGNPSQNLDENGNPKEFPNTKTEEEEIASSYQLVFEEDFNYTGAPGTVEGENDYNGYTYQTGGGGWGNNEVQIYERNERTCYVSNGALKIQVVKVGNQYYSARLNTSTTLSKDWTYGKYEVTAKLPAGNGPWPAIWMMPNNYGYHGTWPKCGEIDIMETSQYYKNRIIGTIHTNSYNHTKNTQKSGGVNNSTIYSQYHKYSIEWLPDQIKFFFDDNCYFVFKPSSYITSESQSVTVNEWPFDYSFHFIFNIAMGGDMGGNISSTLFNDYDEIAMYIDRIAVYQSTYINEHYL